MWQELVDKFTYDTLELSRDDHFAHTLNFFIYDTVKIMVLLATIIFVVTFLRTFFDTNKVRDYLAGKNMYVGNVLAALFGIITPFCTCSAITLFLGFVQARIPLGVTLSFLISAPLNNEIAIAMLLALFGWKIAALYIAFGLTVAIVAGIILGKMNLEKYIMMDIKPSAKSCSAAITSGMSLKERIDAAVANVKDILGKTYIYIIIGIAIGGFIHGYVPADMIVKYAGGDSLWSVPMAVLLGVPMYSNAAGIMPLVEVLTQKGMMMGTALAFMMAVTALSLPEAIILKRILHTRLIVLFFGIVAVGIIINGYLFNLILG